MDEIKSLLNALLEGQEKIAADVEAIKMDIAKLRGEVKEGFERVDARFDQLDQDFDTLAHKTFDARVKLHALTKKVEGE